MHSISFRSLQPHGSKTVSEMNCMNILVHEIKPSLLDIIKSPRIKYIILKSCYIDMNIFKAFELLAQGFVKD